VDTTFPIFLLMRAGVEKPYSFKKESVAFKILRLPFFARVEASPQAIFAFVTVSAVQRDIFTSFVLAGRFECSLGIYGFRLGKH